MKRFVIALLLITVVLAVSITSSRVLHHRIDTLHTALAQLLVLIGEDDTQALRQQNQAVQEAWTGLNRMLHMLTTHRNMDELELNILLLSQQLDEPNQTQLHEACANALALLEDVKDSETISWKTIF